MIKLALLFSTAIATSNVQHDKNAHAQDFISNQEVKYIAFEKGFKSKAKADHHITKNHIPRTAVPGFYTSKTGHKLSTKQAKDKLAKDFGKLLLSLALIH